MLAESTKVDLLAEYALDDRWWFEQKVDGHRLVTVVENGVVTFLNRQGVQKSTLPIEPQLQTEFSAMTRGQWVFDGEIVDDVYWLFDLPVVGDKVKISDPYEFRRDVLDTFFAGWAPGKHIKLLPSWRTPGDKAKGMVLMEDTNREGVMVKDKDAPYLPGKRSRRVLKAKFTKAIDCVVLRVAVDGKENVELALNNGVGTFRAIGQASTIGKPAVAVNDVVEVKFLYAVDRNKPRLVQPTILRRRDDKSPAECTFDQLDTCFTDKTVFDPMK